MERDEKIFSGMPLPAFQNGAAMPRLAANVSMMFTEYPFLQRFQAAADAGFEWVEMLFPYSFGVDEIALAVERAGVRVALFNLPPGQWEAGERGLACHPGRRQELDAGIDRAIPYALALGVKRLHLMAGITPAGAGMDSIAATYAQNVRHAAGRLFGHGIDIMIEPINRHSMPGYFLHRQEDAAALIEQSNISNLRLQFDFFHCQMEQGGVLMRLERFFPLIGHCQLAGAPDRHEPDSGELNYRLVLDRLDQLGYSGVVGLEYNPRQGTLEGLAFARPWLA